MNGSVAPGDEGVVSGRSVDHGGGDDDDDGEDEDTAVLCTMLPLDPRE